MYAKLIDGQFSEAPVNYRGIINYNKYPERLAEDGYKPVEYTKMPADGIDEYDYTDEENPVLVKKADKQYEFSWEEREDKIVQVWNEVG